MRYRRLDFDQLFDMFCEGRKGYRPAWRHVAEYWATSNRLPEFQQIRGDVWMV
jgi:hypothetical protein